MGDDELHGEQVPTPGEHVDPSRMAHENAGPSGTVRNRDPTIPDVVLWSLDHSKHLAKIPNESTVDIAIADSTDDEYKVVWRGHGREEEGWVKRHHIIVAQGQLALAPAMES